MAELDLSKLSAEELTSVINEAFKLKREKTEGVPTNDAVVIKMANDITTLAKKLGIDPSKVVTAIGRNLKPQLSFRAYTPKDPSAPRKPRQKRTK